MTIGPGPMGWQDQRVAIVLVGFMGAGKTTVGRALAHVLGSRFVDSDQVIEQRAGRPIGQIFVDAGEPGFRDLEETTIADLLSDPAVPVLALGGGACERDGTRRLLSRQAVVHLDLPLPAALARIGTDPNRPVLADPDLPGRYTRRRMLYREVATVTVPVVCGDDHGGWHDRPVDDIVAAIVDALVTEGTCDD